MNSLIKRTITGALYVGLVVTALLVDKLFVGAVFLVLSIIGMKEFYSITEKGLSMPNKQLGILFGVLIYIINIAVSFHYVGSSVFIVLLLMYVLILIVGLYKRQRRSMVAASLTLIGIVYVVLPISLIIQLLHVQPNGSYTYLWVLSMFVFVWVNDTGAYLIGRWLGKHKLFEIISPNKTWEGAIGGIFFGLVAASIFAIYNQALSLWEWIGFAILVCVGSIFGDLVESMLKRDYGFKDSGNLLPGHGGVLDRIDSILLAAPLIYVYLYLIL